MCLGKEDCFLQWQLWKESGKWTFTWQLVTKYPRCCCFKKALLISPCHLDLEQIFHKPEWSALIWSLGSHDVDERLDEKFDSPFGFGGFKIRDFLSQSCLTCV